jgi:hypothetical protein
METLTTPNHGISMSTMNSYSALNSNTGKAGLIPHINFNLPSDSVVFLKLIDKNGNVVQMLINGDFLTSGSYSNKMNLNELAPGEYFCVIEANNSRETRLIRVLGKNI